MTFWKRSWQVTGHEFIMYDPETETIDELENFHVIKNEKNGQKEEIEIEGNPVVFFDANGFGC